MRKCPMCGNENEEDAKVCSQCGRNLKEQEEDVEEVSDFPAVDEIETEEASTRALQILKKGAGSTVLHVAIFLYMLMVIYNIASLVLDEMIFFKIITLVQRIMEETMTLPAGVLSEISEKVFSVSNFAAHFILLPEVLCFLGMAMYTLSASHMTEPSKDTGGLTLIQIAVFIELIFYLTIGFVIMGIFVVSMVREWEMGILNSESLTVYLALLGAALVVILLVLFYEIGVIRTIRSLKYTMRTGNPNEDISGYVIFMNFVMSIMVLVFSFLAIPYTEVEGFIVSAMGTLVTILLTSGLIWYRNKLRQLVGRI